MGKWTDKAYITHSEWKNDFGGASSASSKSQFKSLPFNACCLTSKLIGSDPVCTVDGYLFNNESIIRWLKKYERNPITGAKGPVKLIKVKFSKNSAGEYHCSLTFKVFTEHSHIVCIATSGNVYSYDAVQQLNISVNNWKDLVSGDSFARSDIITLQDPRRPELRDMSQFWFVQNDVDADIASSSRQTSNNLRLGSNTMAGRILKEYEEKGKSASALTSVKDDTTIDDSAMRRNKKASNAAHFSTGKMAASFTSTSVAPRTVNEPVLIDENEFMFTKIRKKGYAQMTTNMGDINLELYCNTTPRACFNFLQLARQGYYENVKFHRLIRGFMVQGGDPTGTGRGGRSCFAGGAGFQDEFRTQLSHNERGILSMANKGTGTNTSQFFFTLAACKHLDYKHTIFGRIVGGLSVLDRMESIETDGEDRPEQDIVITGMLILVDPFEEYREAEAAVKEKEEKAAKRKAAENAGGEYPRARQPPQPPSRPHRQEQQQPKKKAKRATDLSDFSAW